MSENLSSLLIGVLFGASLDLAGFGSPRRLNDQFLLRDFSMLKVMFGAIVVAAAIYLLMLDVGSFPAPDSLVPTLDLAVLVGAFLLGAGLVVGGYCPGTALAGAAGGRVDAMLFFVMMYPGYRLWVWLEPRVKLDFHAALAPNHLTLPDLLGVPQILVLVGLGLACLLGWKLGDHFEARSQAKGVARRG
jgi:uncharacterized membrane protein YedE/YeeE